MGNVLYTPNTKDAVDGERIGVGNGLLTKAATGVYLVVSDAVEANSTADTIIATAHAVRAGDLIRFTSGVLSGYEASVKSVLDVNTFRIVTMPVAPAATDTFDVLRYRTPLLDANGNQLVSGGATAVAYVDSAVTEYGTTPVTTGAWVQIIAALPSAASGVEIFDSSGEIMELGVGAAASEARVWVIQPGGNGRVPLTFASGARISLRAITASANVTGTYNILNFFS